MSAHAGAGGKARRPATVSINFTGSARA